MRGRNFFLAFFVAFGLSAALMLYLDTRPRTLIDLVPRSANVDTALPLANGSWLLQLVVRSGISQPYYRSVLVFPDTLTTVALPGFMAQYYPLGYREGALQLFREEQYISTLTGSLILSRLKAPSSVTGEVLELNGLQPSLISVQLLKIQETGLPFRCAGQLNSADYGGSDTTFFTLDSHSGRIPWITLTEPVPELPFCGSDHAVYLSVDKGYYRYYQGKLQKHQAKLHGRFDGSGSWLGLDKGNGPCRYLQPDWRDYPRIMTQPVFIDDTSPCADRWYATAGVTAATRGWETVIVGGTRGERRVHGRLLGLSGGWAVVQTDLAAAWIAYADEVTDRALHTKDLFPSFPRPETDS